MNIIFALLLVVTIFSKYNAKKLYNIFKPTFSLLILLLPILFSISLDKLPTQLILLGLTAALVGDIFLLNPDKFFNLGLISFLLSHIFYSVSFLLQTNKFNLELSIIYLLIFISTLVLFRKNLNFSIGIYMFVILLMGYLAGSYWLQSSNLIGVQIFAASILFIISDFTLAFNKFRHKFFLAEFLILSTYYTAQYLFALTILK
ncbi:MAG: lysoplasmalogenase [Ignavibacteriales bacterium]